MQVRENTEQTEIDGTNGKKEDEVSEKLIYEEESYVIRGACMEVYKVMGNGFLIVNFGRYPLIEWIRLPNIK